MYHSSALLLPDATVLIGGGGAPGPLTNLNAEIFYPPYLYDAQGHFAARPSFTLASTGQDYGATVKLTANGSISRVVLIKTGAVTHSFDFEQRYIPLSFTSKGDALNVRMPTSANVATPGFYHLFIVNSQGVPSVSKIISLGRDLH